MLLVVWGGMSEKCLILKVEPNISGLFEHKLSQKANIINFGNRNGKNDTPHQTTAFEFGLP